MEYSKNAILTTLLYSDIFDFPLMKRELWEFLVSDRKISKKTFDKTLNALLKQKRICHTEEYYAIAGKEGNIEKRKANLSEVDKKLQIAKKAAHILSHIPSIKLIGISGGLAMNDVDVSDDIDFFIIAKKNTVFTTRLFILGVLEILNLRRVRQDKNPADKICVNLIIDEAKLKWPFKKHDVYTAHEIVQIKPLFERDNIYKKFIGSNQWIRSFFPNFANPTGDYSLSTRPVIYNLFKVISFFLNFKPMAFVLEWTQARYIKQHQTRESVSQHALAFHPIDYRVQTLAELNLKSHELGLLTKF